MDFLIELGGTFMETITLQMAFPKGMTPYLVEEDKEETFRRNAMILYPYIKSARISHGKAAEILGVRKWNLIEFYNSMGMPYLDQSKEDLLSEVDAFNRVMEKQV